MITFRELYRHEANSKSGEESAAFTRTDLLTILSILGLVVVMLWPTYAANRSDSQAFQCLNNHRQLCIAWVMYSTDNRDKLPSTRPVTGLMSWAMLTENTNAESLVVPDGFHWAPDYVKSASVWKCPADIVPGPNGPRVRSISFNGPLTGSRPSVARPSYPIGRYYLDQVQEMSQLRKPAEVFVTMDEHPDSINDSTFMFDPGKIPPLYSWRDVPASYHNGAAVYSSADGRAALHLWRDSTTMQPVRRQPKAWGASLVSPNSPDIEWMNNMMPYQEE